MDLKIFNAATEGLGRLKFIIAMIRSRERSVGRRFGRVSIHSHIHRDGLPRATRSR
jgi:hypothetical protein